MTELAIRCASCSALLHVGGDVRFVTCASCGSALEIVRAGGAAYAAIDREQAPGEAEVSAEGAGGARRSPGRASSMAAGAASAAAGAGWVALAVDAGAWGWAGAGALVAVAGIAAALRALWAGARRS